MLCTKKEKPWLSNIQKWCRCLRKLLFTTFGISSLIKPNCPDGEEKFKIKKYNFFSYYRWFKEEQKAWSLDHAAQVFRNVVKLYVSDRIKTDRLPDIDNFNCRYEIFKIHHFLWNFLFRISSTDKEEKLQRSCFSWDSHYLDTPFNVSRMLPRLFTASCIFNLQNSQCVEPLHLLLTGISDKFSDSSSSFLSINARIGGRHLEGFIGAVHI